MRMLLGLGPLCSYEILDGSIGIGPLYGGGGVVPVAGAGAGNAAGAGWLLLGPAAEPEAVEDGLGMMMACILDTVRSWINMGVCSNNGRWYWCAE